MYGATEIKTKQRSNNEDWFKLYRDCTNIPKQHIDLLARKTMRGIVETIKRNNFKTVGYCWSGGKDSLVMWDLIEKSDAKMDCGFCVIHDNEYPAFEKHLRENAPHGIEYRYSHRLSLEYLDKHNEYLFPTERRMKDAYIEDWRKAQFQFFKDKGLDVLLTGRRLIDGNRCEKNANGDYLAVNKQGVVKFDFMAEWSHAEVLAYIRYNNLELPANYTYPNGFVLGTHRWTGRPRVNNSFFDTFDEVAQIDIGIIEKASEKLTLAREYLEYKKHGGEKK